MCGSRPVSWAGWLRGPISSSASTAVQVPTSSRRGWPSSEWQTSRSSTSRSTTGVRFTPRRASCRPCPSTWASHSGLRWPVFCCWSCSCCDFGCTSRNSGHGSMHCTFPWMNNPMRVLVLLLLLLSSPAMAQQPAPDQSQQPKQTDEFVPISQLPAQDQLPAAPLLVTAYAFVWVVFFAYVVSVGRRLTKVQHEVERLESDIAKRT